MDQQSYCEAVARRAKAASRLLTTVTGERKNHWLTSTAQALEERMTQLLEANQRDVAEATDLSSAQIDRLRLTPERIGSMARSLRAIAAQPDPVGAVLEGGPRPNNLHVYKVGVPLGVIFFIYESRPNVTVDAAGLCVKSGNAILLRGGKEAHASNTALHAILQQTLRDANLPEEAVQLVNNPDRALVDRLLTMHQEIDLVIPRGGESLIRRVVAGATMPVMKHYLGNCHVYVDRTADLAMAERIVINAKCSRPGVCNAAESLLLHQDIAEAFLQGAGKSLTARGVELRGCPKTCALAPQAKPATEADYQAEFLDLILSVKIVSDLEEAMDHIARHGSQHTEAIITNDLAAARRFTQAVDSSAVLVNASTRFNDGLELGLGGEIGISTDKYHARGPCGLRELCSYKYLVWGDGQIRE